MFKKENIEKLAALARITIPEDQKEKVRADIETILEYVEHIKKAHVLTEVSDRLPENLSYSSGVINIFREDKDFHQPGIYTEKLLQAAPNRERNYIKVKKILIF